MGISYIRLESLAGISGKVELSGDSKWKWSRMGEGQRVSGASPLEGCKGYLSLWGPADSARVPHLPVFDELGTRLQTGAIRQIFIQKQGSHSGHQGHVRDPGTPSFKCTEHCWKKPWFLIKPISLVLYESKKQDLRFYFFFSFCSSKANFPRKPMKQQQQFSHWGSSNIFHHPRAASDTLKQTRLQRWHILIFRLGKKDFIASPLGFEVPSTDGRPSEVALTLDWRPGDQGPGWGWDLGLWPDLRLCLRQEEGAGLEPVLMLRPCLPGWLCLR